jgi:hypothetical protein
VSAYLLRVNGESEMRYLLLEKDIEERDALDLISKCNISLFLKSQFAENVVKEIWRSPYATNDSIYTASTNYFMLFQYYHCEQDLEKKNRMFQGKKVENIENHAMQFNVWRYSGKSRTIAELVTTILIATLVHRLLRDALDMDQTIIATVKQI